MIEKLDGPEFIDPDLPLTVGVGKLRIPAETAGLRMIAIFELIKATAVLIVGWGMLAFVHHDLGLAALDVVRRFHLDPTTRFPSVMIAAAHLADTTNHVLIAAAATLYASVRVSEAIGLWLDRNWGNWIGALSGGIYLPVEIYEVFERYTIMRLTLLVGNLLIVIFLCHRLRLQALAAKVAKVTGEPVREVLDRAEGKVVDPQPL